MTVDSACSNRLPSLKFVGDTLSVSALIGRMTLTFDLLTSNALLHVGRAAFLPILVFLGLFVIDLLANTCQMDHVTLRPWSLTLEVMAFVGDTDLSVPSVYQDWTSQAFQFGRCDTLPVSTLVDLVTLTSDLWPWNWCALLPAGWATQPSYTNFSVSRTFRSRLMGQHVSDASRDLATLTFDLGGHGACRWYGSSYSVCTKFEVRRPSRSEDIAHLLCEY